MMIIAQLSWDDENSINNWKAISVTNGTNKNNGTNRMT